MREKVLNLNIGENHASSNFELTLCKGAADYSHTLKLTTRTGHECRDAAYREATSAISVTITSKELKQLSEFLTRALLQFEDL